MKLGLVLLMPVVEIAKFQILHLQLAMPWFAFGFAQFAVSIVAVFEMLTVVVNSMVLMDAQLMLIVFVMLKAVAAIVAIVVMTAAALFALTLVEAMVELLVELTVVALMLKFVVGIMVIAATIPNLLFALIVEIE